MGVQESVVPAGTSQRRPGLHTEGFTRLTCESGTCLNTLAPPELVGCGGDIEHLRACIQEHLPEPPRPRVRKPPDSSARTLDQKGAPVGNAHMAPSHGGARVKGPISLQANELFWMTDRTPHESMPVAEGTRRQYFRLVAGKVDAWFAAHSTPNPLGTQPDAKILNIDKFTGRTVVEENASVKCMIRKLEGLKTVQ